MAEIQHELKIKADPSAVFDALTTAEGLKGWYAAEVENQNGGWTFTHTSKDHLKFAFEVTESESPSKVSWRCSEGPNQAKGTSTTYLLSDTGDGRTLVELSHTEWPGSEGNYRKCNTFWGIMLYHLKQYLETGEKTPAF